MKRTVKIALLAGLAIVLLPSLTIAQDKKEQQKIKIVVSDNGGTKVLIDTLFSGEAPDSITLRNGNVLYVKSGHLCPESIKEPGKNEKNIYITYSSSASSSSSADNEDKVSHKRIYYCINKDDRDRHEGRETFNIEVNSDQPEKNIEKSSYVIAKNGMVVTIEGGTEEQVKELAKVIESKLEASKDDKQGTRTVTKEDKRKQEKK